MTIEWWVEGIFVLSQGVSITRAIYHSKVSKEQGRSVTPVLYWGLTILIWSLIATYGFFIGSFAMMFVIFPGVVYALYHVDIELKGYIRNIIFFPLRLILSHKMLNKMGLKSIRDERIEVALKFCEGKVLDIGCGNNQLIQKYIEDGNGGLGIDIFNIDNQEDILMVENCNALPLPDESYDTACFVASLHHIPNDLEVLKEIKRVLRKDGKIVITEPPYLVGLIRHKLAWWNPDKNNRGYSHNEKLGLTNKYILNLLSSVGFELEYSERFCAGLNKVYVFGIENRIRPARFGSHRHRKDVAK